MLRRSCDQIDRTGGRYDAEGHSDRYGYGRLNAKTAVTLAGEVEGETASPVVTYRTVHSVIRDVPIEDLKICSLALEIADDQPILSLLVTVAIEHTYIGDLVVRLRPPGGAAHAITLHDRAGADADNLRRSFDPASTSALAGLIGTRPKGTWTLEVEDTAQQDQGAIRSWSVELGL
jgi:subtilisin-like proprotein convertase family protein